MAAANDPLRRWKEWSDAFNPDVDLITDAGGHYASDWHFTARFRKQHGVAAFRALRPEMAALIAEAPPELKVVLDSDGSTVDHVSFEYRSVAVVRPWFRAVR